MLKLLNLLTLLILQLAAADNTTGIFRPRISGQALHQHILKKYNKLTLPVESPHDNVDIRLLLELVSLTDIDEKNQIMITQVWLRHEWQDSSLVWNPLDYDNITKMHLPAEAVWVPDTVLYNNADGDYQITIKTKVTVNSDGKIVWLPPAIYKSFCAIDVKYFPFDEQVCELKFGPWTYDISKVDYWLYDPHDANKTMRNFLLQAADMSGYSESVEWDVLEIDGKRTVWRYQCCPEEYVDITYRIHLRRKSLFYTINLIIPWLLISFLTIAIFYLPTQSGEKLTLTISIFVSMTFFILVLYEIIPPTSLVLPLMSKYLLFTMMLLASSIVITVMILALHFRHPHAHNMPNWVRLVFLVRLPKLLCAESPLPVKLQPKRRHENPYENDEVEGLLDPIGNVPIRPNDYETLSRHRGSFFHYERSTGVRDKYGRNVVTVTEVDDPRQNTLDVDDVKQVIRDVRFISYRYRENTEESERKAEWQALARVIDRLFLFVFAGTVSIGTYAILVSAPALYDTTEMGEHIHVN